MHKVIRIRGARVNNLKNVDKRVSTLKSLPPKKNHIHIIKNKNIKNQNKSNLEHNSENELLFNE